MYRLNIQSCAPPACRCMVVRRSLLRLTLVTYICDNQLYNRYQTPRVLLKCLRHIAISEEFSISLLYFMSAAYIFSVTFYSGTDFSVIRRARSKSKGHFTFAGFREVIKPGSRPIAGPRRSRAIMYEENLCSGLMTDLQRR